MQAYEDLDLRYQLSSIPIAEMIVWVYTDLKKDLFLNYMIMSLYGSECGSQKSV